MLIPISSAIWNALFNHEYPSSSTSTSITSSSSRTSTSSSHSPSTTSHTKRHTRSIIGRSVSRITELFNGTLGLQALATVDQLLKTFVTNGPVVARMSFSGLLKQPLFTITLQRDTVDIGGNAGLLSLGELPPGVSNSSLTWGLLISSHGIYYRH